MNEISTLFDGVQHLGLPTGCFDKTVAFYTYLGFTCIYNTVNNGSQVAFLQQGNLVIETYESAEVAGKAGAWDHVALSCSDIERAYAIIKGDGFEIVSNGIEFLPFFDHGVRFFTFLGPNSEKVEFNQKSEA